MIAYLRQTEYEPNLLDKKITNNKTYDLSEQNIKPDILLEKDREYTVSELIAQMIIYSDNNAYDLLMENINNDLVFNVYKDLGVDISQALSDPSGNIVSVKDYASFFRTLYNASYLDQINSEKALKLLSQIKFHQALTAGVPEDVKVAHKFGERQYLATGEKQLHDCGIVYFPQKPYLLCIMTRGTDFTKAANTIKEISKTIYNNLNKN